MTRNAQGLYSSNEPKYPKFWNRVVAYLGFVTNLTLCFWIIFGAYELANGWDATTNDPLVVQIQHFAKMLPIPFMIIWTTSFIFAVIPFAIWMIVAKKKEAYSLRSFAIGGSAMGLVLSPFFASIPNFGFNVSQDIGTYALHQLAVFLPILGVSGAISGIVCRRILAVPKTS